MRSSFLLTDIMTKGSGLLCGRGCYDKKFIQLRNSELLRFKSITGKFFAESMNTVNIAVLIELTRNSCVSSRAACKSALSELNVNQDIRRWIEPCFACSSSSHYGTKFMRLSLNLLKFKDLTVSNSPFCTMVLISIVALKCQSIKS